MIRLYSESDYSNLVVLNQLAFAGYPWFEDLSNEETESRLAKSFLNKCCCHVFSEDGVLAGATWFEEIDLGILRSERGEELINFLKVNNLNKKLIWIRETVVHPDYQGKGIASKLKQVQMDWIKINYKDHILLTRMRDDNFAIIKINERVGMKRTGVKVRSSQRQGTFHEYWYM